MMYEMSYRKTGVSVVLDSEIVSVNEMEGSVEVCVNLTGQSEIDIPVIFTTSNLSAIGINFVVNRILLVVINFFLPK